MKSKFSPLAPLLGICLAIVPVRADDIYWVGYQDGCMSNPPDEASFLHGDNWLNYVYPGEQCILDPGLPCDDRAIFGAEESPGGNPGWPHVVHFGDFCFNVPNCSAVTHPGNDVVIQRLEIQDDAFTFDFGPGSAAAGSCPNDPTASGSLTVTGANGISVIVGSVITDTDGTPTNLPVDAHLTIRNGTLAAKEFVVGDLGTSNGGITVSGQQGVLNCNNNLAIGQHGDGTLLIENGGSVFNTYADIGRFTGATGYAEVTGPTSTWTCSEWLNVGYLGDGTLVIDDGTVEVTQPTNLGSESSNGVVTVRNGGDFLLHHWIGLARTEGSTATLTVEDPGSAVVADEGLMVGVAGDGELTIRSSATVTSDVTNLGEQPGSTGRATIASGAVWNNAGWANVGWKGTGILNINGGTMSSAWIGVGTEATGIGTADVTSSGSWNTLGLNIGDKGHGTVTVSNQGSVVVADWSSLGSTAAEAHGELVVDNGSFETRGMNVGLAGTGVLTLRNGGQLSTEFDENDATGLTAGNFLGSHGTVTVDGSGSSLSIPHWMNVGWAGQGALTIQGGGQVAATWCGVGTESTGTGTVTVDGVGSSLSLRWLDVGIAGVGQVTVSNEASVTLDAEGWSSLGWDTADSSGRLEIVEGGSFDAPGMNVGLAGAGDFEISSGGQATFSDGITIGAYAGSSGTAAVTGLGSSLTSLDWMNVGADGEGTLNVTAGGSVSSPWCGIGVDPTGAGQVTVSGPGSTMSATLTIGWEGSGSMLVTNSGVVNAYEVDIAEVGPGTLRIQNAGIFSSHTQDFDCGNGGACTINIDSGGVLSVFDGGDGHAVAFVGNPGPGLATVSGPGSRFDVEGQLQVGSAGTGTLSVSDRGRVNITGNAPNSGGLGFIGMAAGSSGDVRVSGEGSSWTSRGQLQVASEGDGILLIEGGARVVTGVSNSPTNSSGIVGATAGSVGSVTVRDDGSEWQQDGGMSVGFNGVGVLSIEAGGSISSEHGFVGRFAGSTGDATVTGTNSRWDAAQQFFIGNAGGGSLSITNGGAVSMNWGGVGHRQGSHGAVLVDGGTSIWSATGTIFVGSEGTGTVTVANAGRVHAGLLDVRTRGTAGGNGSLECDVANAGAIHPGLSAGTLAIDGDYFQSATGTLNIEIGGTTPGTDYDRLDTAGTVILGGTLAVDLIGDYAPQPGDVFEIMTFASRDGRFADVFCVTLAGGNTLNVRYSATNVTLEVGPTCGGACVDLSLDCDGDGIPDACEIANCPPDTPSCADCNNNGVPDGCDIADGTSLDDNMDGVPDECVEWDDESVEDENWSTDLNWLGDIVPGIGDPAATESVVIDFDDAAVNLDTSVSINSLVLGETSTLNINGADMTLDAPNGIRNDGSMAITNDHAITAAEAMSIKGTAPLLLASPGASISSAALGDTITNRTTIAGQGVIDADFLNEAVVSADVSGTTLDIAGDHPKVNNGLMQATGGGTLSVTSPSLAGNGDLLVDGCGNIHIAGGSAVTAGSAAAFGAGDFAIGDGASLDLTGPLTLDASAGGPAPEMGCTPPRLSVTGAAAITTAGAFTITGGSYEASAVPASAALSSSSITITPVIGVGPGALILEDAMSVTTTGAMTLAAVGCAGPNPPEGCTPPRLVAINAAHVAVGGDFVIEDTAEITVALTYDELDPPFTLAGDFSNASGNPAMFDWSAGPLTLDGGGALQLFEVAGADLGPVIEGFDTNFAMDTVEIAADSAVVFSDFYENQLGGEGPCGEALYTRTLFIRSGATATIDNCRVYAETIINEGGMLELLGCGSLETLCPGDFDGNCIVNLDDFGSFHGCLTGPGGSVSPDCAHADLDHDGDVDLLDFGSFQSAFSSSGE